MSGVKVTYRVAGQESNQKIYEATSTCARIGLPDGSFPTKPEPGDFQYSGMHDAGPLDEPREGGSVAKLIHAVLQAKEYNDTYLTTVIEAEKAETLPAESPSCNQAKKKAKVEG